jgi:hypothetical protein
MQKIAKFTLFTHRKSMLIVAYLTNSVESPMRVASLSAITAAFPISNSTTAPNTAGTLTRNAFHRGVHNGGYRFLPLLLIQSPYPTN